MSKPIVFTFLGNAKQLNKTIAGTMGGMGKLAAFAPVVGTALAGGIGLGSVKAFQTFDQAMVKSQAIMGDLTNNEMKAMEKAAREVGKTTTFSAAEAAESFFFLASAGLDAKQSIAALPEVSKFAQAGAFDMALATDLLTDAQSALGLASKDTAENMEGMSRVSNVLVKANTLANASVEQFSTSLTNKAGAALKVANKSVEEGVAVLSAFADRGIKGEAAGTALGTMMGFLATQAEKNKDKFAEFGIEILDNQGNLKNMADVMAEFEDGMGSMSDEQKAHAFRMLGINKLTKDSILSLLGSSDAIRTYQAELENAGGTVDEIAKNQLKSMSAQLDLAKSKLIDMGIGLGGVLAPHILSGVTFLSEGFDKWSKVIQDDLLPPAKDFFNRALDFGRGVLPSVVSGIRSVVGIGKDLVGFFKENNELIIGAAVGIGAVLVPAFTGWAVAAGLAAVATIAANAPLIAIGVVIGGVAALFIKLYRENDEFRAKADAMGRVLRDNVLPILAAVGNFIMHPMLPAIGSLVFWIGTKLIQALTWTYNLMSGDFARGLGVITNFMGNLKDKASEVWNNFKLGIAVIVTTFNNLPLRIGALKNKIISAIKSPFETAFNWVEDKWSKISSIFDKLFNFSGGLGIFGRAFGGPVAKGGMFNVGENGPEKVFLPKGAHVVPAHQTDSGGGNNINVNVHTNANPYEIGNEIAFQLSMGGF